MRSRLYTEQDGGHYVCKHEQMHMPMKCNEVKKCCIVMILEHVDGNYERNNMWIHMHQVQLM